MILTGLRNLNRLVVCGTEHTFHLIDTIYHNVYYSYNVYHIVYLCTYAYILECVYNTILYPTLVLQNASIIILL